ncbi:Tyrosine--tRNA ligase [Balamuthia mandrillaris]
MEASNALTPEAKYALITKDLQEIVGEEDIKAVLKERDVNIYWGTATTGKPHLGYFVPMYKISDFLAAGAHVTILFADLHAYLDNMKSSWELLQARCSWYEFIIREMLTLIGVPLDKLKFVRGTEFQLSPTYTMDMYKMSALVTTEHTTKAGAEVVKSAKSPLMSSLLYPILQALDEQYLDVDIQFGGVDQRKIFMFARENLPRIGYKKRAHLMNWLIPGLGKSGKMSSSEPLSKIDFDDTDKIIRDKFKQAYSVDGQPEGNGLLAMLRFILFRYLEKQGKPFVAPRAEKWGGPQVFNTYAEVEAAFSKPEGDPDKLMSGDLKKGLADLMIEFLAPLRAKVLEKWDLCVKAYPEAPTYHLENEPKQKEKAAPKKKGKQQSSADVRAYDIRVGKIVSVKKHDNADTLYVEQIDVGEDKPRTIVSGLVNHIPIEKMQDRLVLVVTNLKPAPLKGVESQGMVLAAATREKENPTIDLVNVPEGSKVGERVSFEGLDDAEPDLPFISQSKRKKLAKDLLTSAEGVAMYGSHAFKTSAGVCTSTILNGYIS